MKADEIAGDHTEAAQKRPPIATAKESPGQKSPSAVVETSTAANEVDDSQVDAIKLQDTVRRLMRQVPSSVAVITVASVDPELNKPVPMGVAVSSLSTVTLDPPTISFNIKHPSRTLDAIRAADGRFRVHFPAADRGGASMVESFCRGNHAAAYEGRKRSLRIRIPGSDSHSSNLPISASRAPQIVSNSVRAAMECTITHELQVADHVVLVARVDSMESNDARDRTIIYVDGVYLRADGTKLTSHATPADTPQNSWSVWDYPLNPGDKERRDYMKRIRNIAKIKPGALLKGRALRGLDASLPLTPAALGINLEQLIHEVCRELGTQDELPVHLQLSSPLLEFWNRISPNDRAKISKRAKNLVTEDPAFLTLHYKVLLQYLGVSVASIDFLPSDLAAPLRAAGLLGPFERRTQADIADSRYYTLQYLEQMEHRLIEHLAKIGHEEAVRTRLEDVMTAFGENRLAAKLFNKARGRLYTIAFPELFTPDKIDIAGHISQAEARVVVSRVLRFLRTDHPAVFRKNMNIDMREILRLVRVNPTITGFNVEFFSGKIRHLEETTRYFRDLPGRLQEMLKPWLADTITWADLETRVKDFVQKSPMRAMSWPNRDKLAAMGLAWESTLSVPITSNYQPLNRGHILDTLVAKELKSMYNKLDTSSDLNSAIARYLKEQYNFDVDPASPIQLDANARSSSDDMQEAMMANRHVDVAGSKKDEEVKEEEEEEDVALAYAGPRIRGIKDSKSANKHFKGDEGVGDGKEAGKEKTWRTYSLVSGKKFG